jgi:hypothetical protein
MVVIAKKIKIEKEFLRENPERSIKRQEYFSLQKLKQKEANVTSKEISDSYYKVLRLL